MEKRCFRNSNRLIGVFSWRLRDAKTVYARLCWLGCLVGSKIKIWIIMLNRNKHPYKIDERFLPGKLVVMYVKYRFLHSWGFLALTLFWLSFSILFFYLIWNEGLKMLFGAGFILIILYCFLMAAWSKIVDYRNLCLEKKIVYPIVDRLLAKSTKLSSRKCRVKRRKLISIDDGSIDSPSESVVVFFGDGGICEYPFSFMAEKCKGAVIVRSLSLTHYVCKNERRISEAKSLLPELSFNSWLKLVSFLILFLGGISFCIFTFLPPEVFFIIIFLGVVLIMLFIYLCPQLESHNVQKVTWKMALFKVMKTPISVICLFIILNLPFMALLIVSVVSVISAVLPVYIVIFLTNKAAPGLICKPTEYFVILVLSSFILVYCPSYIKRIICRTPFVTNTEGKRFKKRIAELIIYIYDAGSVEFLLNVAYAVFVCIICIKKFQFSEFLFSKDIDEAILNAFVVFLSFEGIRSSYKRIHLSAVSLFQKILRLLDT